MAKASHRGCSRGTTYCTRKRSRLAGRGIRWCSIRRATRARDTARLASDPTSDPAAHVGGARARGRPAGLLLSAVAIAAVSALLTLLVAGKVNVSIQLGDTTRVVSGGGLPLPAPSPLTDSSRNHADAPVATNGRGRVARAPRDAESITAASHSHRKARKLDQKVPLVRLVAYKNKEARICVPPKAGSSSFWVC